MKSRLIIMIALAVAVVSFAGTMSAHHGANLYDSTKAVMMKGTITQFEWGNPHNQIYFDVKDDKGSVTCRWFIPGTPNSPTKRCTMRATGISLVTVASSEVEPSRSGPETIQGTFRPANAVGGAGAGMVGRQVYMNRVQ